MYSQKKENMVNETITISCTFLAETDPPLLVPAHSLGQHGVLIPKLPTSLIGHQFCQPHALFAGMVHNEDTTCNIDQVPNSLDAICIFLE